MRLKIKLPQRQLSQSDSVIDSVEVAEMPAMPQKSHPKGWVPAPLEQYLTADQAFAVVESWLAACEASAPPAYQLCYSEHIRRSLPCLAEVLHAVNA